MKTNFDSYLDAQLRDPGFAARFARAGEAWDIALQIAAAREKAGLSQRELAERVGTTQQQISRLESPNYEGHSLSMLRRVAQALDARVRFSFEPIGSLSVAEDAPAYKTTTKKIRTTSGAPTSSKKSAKSR
jgi:transcriptional regulator with XRE-family HTH domain